MEWKKINAGDARYVSEFMQDFEPGVWNKKLADTGGSHLIITNDINYVLVVPNVDLVKSLIKDGGEDKVFGVYGGIYEQQFKNFVKENGVPKKIATTWDSLYKVMDWINPADYQVCVDEYHLIFESIGFRLKAINKMMSLLDKFKNVRYITATPNQDEFEFEVLKKLPHYEIEWNRIEKIKPIMHKSNNVVVSTCMFVNKLLEGKLEAPDTNGNMTKVEEIYIFLNSVKTIEQICQSLGLDSSEVKICCADRKRNRYILDEYPIEDVTAPNKKINFFTSKCFQGCNLYTKNGLVLMVADTVQPSLMIDMSTQGAQIAGRIRNTIDSQNCFRNTIIYIYRTNNKLTPEALEEEYQKNLSKSEDIVRDYAIVNQTYKELADNNQDKYMFVIEDGIPYISEDKKAYAKYQNYLRTTYRNDFTIMASFNKDKFSDAVEKTWTRWTDETCKQLSKLKVITYRTVVEDYFTTNDVEWLDEYPELADYKQYLTIDVCKTLHFVKEKMIKRVCDIKQSWEIMKNMFVEDKFYSSADIKSKLDKKFKEEGIDIKAKASLLEGCPYIECESTSGWVNGATKQGYKINAIYKLTFNF